LLKFVGELELRFGAADGGENAILRDSGVEFAEDVIDVGGGHEVAGERLGERRLVSAGLESALSEHRD